MIRASEWCAKFGPIEGIPEYQEPRTCRVCGKPLAGRQRAFCSNFPTDKHRGRYWPKDGSIPCAYHWEARYWLKQNWLKRHICAVADYICRDCGLVCRRAFVDGGPEQGDPSMMHVHHVVPRSEGGEDSPDNLIALCRDCHVARHRKMSSG